MAVTAPHAPSCRVAEDIRPNTFSAGKDLPCALEFPDVNKRSRLHTDSKHETSGKPLWTKKWGGPSLIHAESTYHVSVPEPEPSCDPLATEVNAFLALLRACTRNKDLVEGIRIHNDLMERGLLRRCSNALVTMYAKCGELEKAREVLDRSRSKDVVAWTALISGYAHEGQGEIALSCLDKMLHNGVVPNEVTYVCALKACAMIRAVDKGKQIHDEIMRQGLLQNKIALGNALVDMYAKCGNVLEARRVLKGLPSRDVVSWNALLAGFAHEGEADQALNCLVEMQCEGIEPDAVTYLCALKACAALRDVERGKEIHDKIARQGLLMHQLALGGVLVDMYAKCGYVSKAREVLKELPIQDVVAWSSLMAGYVQEGDAKQALNCFQQMQSEGISPDAIMYVYALKACAMMKDADKGKTIHDEIETHGWLKNDVVLGNALVDMYAKCGNFSKARHILEKLPFRDVVSWNALITGYAQRGEAEQVLKSVEQMEREGVLPNAVTCASVLNLCSHLGLVEEGEAIFANMSKKYAVIPTLECYLCMIDLFGRAGHLLKAMQLIQKTPVPDNIAIWHALLGTCWKWADVNVGAWAFEKAVMLDKSYGPAYIMMGNIYAVAGMGEKAKIIEAMRIKNRAY